MKITNWKNGVLILPAIIALLALNGYGFVFKAGVPVICTLLIVILNGDSLKLKKDIWFVVGALIFSAAGDWFLSFKGDSFIRFAAGIGLYFFAHLGYLGYALANGRLSKLFTAVLLLVYLLFFWFALVPNIEEMVLLIAVLIYLLVSCISLGAAAGVQLPGIVKWNYFFGIVLILFSDTIIAFHEFTTYQELNFLILPTYYAAHLFITFGLINKINGLKEEYGKGIKEI